VSEPLLVTCRLAGVLAVGPEGPPQLDALLEYAMSTFTPKPYEGYRLDRATPLPEQGSLRIPLSRERLGDWLVARCSSPILPECRETVEHVSKRLSVEEATLLHPAQRLVVTTTNAWTKSYRLPLRVLAVDRVCWFAVGTGHEIRSLLRRCVHAVGKKAAHGYGRVKEWVVERAGGDYNWYAPHERGKVLMRPLPSGKWLPKDLVGWRPGYGAVCAPYWHPERYCERVEPC
jgi:hypothetical protein